MADRETINLMLIRHGLDGILLSPYSLPQQKQLRIAGRVGRSAAVRALHLAGPGQTSLSINNNVRPIFEGCRAVRPSSTPSRVSLARVICAGYNRAETENLIDSLGGAFAEVNEDLEKLVGAPDELVPSQQAELQKWQALRLHAGSFCVVTATGSRLDLDFTSERLHTTPDALLRAAGITEALPEAAPTI